LKPLERRRRNVGVLEPSSRRFWPWKLIGLGLTNSMATLQQANVAMEHLPFIVDFPIEIFIYGGCPIAMLYFPYKSMDQSLFSDSGDFPLSLKQSVYND